MLKGGDGRSECLKPLDSPPPSTPSKLKRRELGTESEKVIPSTSQVGRELGRRGISKWSGPDVGATLRRAKRNREMTRVGQEI